MGSNETLPILQILNRLVRAYPDRAPAAPTLEIYVESLLGIPAWALEQAAERHISRSNWFPRVAELRGICAEIARQRGALRPEDLPPTPLDYLTWRAYNLEESYYSNHRLDAAEWEALSVQFEQAGRPHRAESTRRRFRSLMSEFTPSEPAS